ncbi:DUF3846 domain-containing protein [Paludisphaera soli]|uniref:DUF3846 domain-containing protein n=1 Tax=Paludisphaera soli TaxID=2712865 RepID=UPI0013EC6AD8|nr:DUF3846 domain-containing protein [Paludisphaera soli]
MKKPKKLVILMVPVGGEPCRAAVDDHCEAWQKAIGDRYFQMVEVGTGVCIVCAEDYHGIEDRPNGCGLYGPYFFVKVDVNGNSRSLTERQLEKCRRYWEARRHEAPPTPDEIDASCRVLALGSEEYEQYRLARRREAEALRRFWDSI